MGAYDAIAVTPSDSTNFVFSAAPHEARYLYVGVTGDVTLVTPDGQTVLFKAHPVGYLWCRCVRVNATATTATNIVAMR
jgi:hypothetical protein